MESCDNPAGRLHELLRRLSEVNPDVSLLTAWAQVLGVAEADVPLRLGGVGQLVADVQEAVDKAGAEAFVATVSRYRDNWANAIFPRDHAFAAAVRNVWPDTVALEALAVVATHLHEIGRAHV